MDSTALFSLVVNVILLLNFIVRYSTTAGKLSRSASISPNMKHFTSGPKNDNKLTDVLLASPVELKIPE